MTLLHIHPDVAAALQTYAPLVALESTVITHGLPFPDNVATALEMEAAVRGRGSDFWRWRLFRGRFL